MKITDVEILTLPDGDQAMVLAVVHTESGLHGLGEIGLRDRYLAVRGALEHLRPLLIGQDASRIEHLWQTMARNGFYPADRIVASAVAAVDVALWDLAGKRFGVPTYELLGGRVRDYVPCYAHVPGDNAPPTEFLAACRALVADGWRHLRFAPPDPVGEPGTVLRRTIERFHSARAALGHDVELIIDVHTRLRAADAVTLCREVEGARPYFVEDPLRAEGLESYRMLRSRTAVPLAAGEQLGSKWEFRRLVEEDLVDVARIDVGIAGGITEARKIAGWCETHYIDIATHVPCGPVNAAAALHLNLATSNVRVQEQTRMSARGSERAGGGQTTPEFFDIGFTSAAGRLTPSGRPGLGVEIDLAAARAAPEPRPAERSPLHRPDGTYTNW
ncbi:mandelate racemase/muconate lactonizing enzyme family protein [Streptomyces sp. NPDC020917]|uniref:mandelate racemase/muconate lactonizing enzyme family protein n=1 Tax=Streptomyces sp. NPDC020917 TaxID=3365102 RepID=UPI0037960332